MSSLVQLSGGIAHQLRSPLISLAAYSSLLNDKLETDVPDYTKTLETSEKIINSVDQISSLLKCLSHLGAGTRNSDFHKTSLSLILEESVALLEGKLMDLGIRLTTHFP